MEEKTVVTATVKPRTAARKGQRARQAAKYAGLAFRAAGYRWAFLWAQRPENDEGWDKYRETMIWELRQAFLGFMAAVRAVRAHRPLPDLRFAWAVLETHDQATPPKARPDRPDCKAYKAWEAEEFRNAFNPAR